MSPSGGPSLIVRLPNWVGDVIMSLPALARLQAAGFTLELIGKRWAGPLLAGQGWSPASLPAGTGARIRLLRDLRRAAPLVSAPRGRPDALLLTNSFSSALEARLAGLHPLGYRQDGRGLLLTLGIDPPAGGHESARFDRLAQALLKARPDVADVAEPAGSSPDQDEAGRELGRSETDRSGLDRNNPAWPRLCLMPAAVETADALLGRHLGADPGAFACLVPFATGTLEGASKAWPAFPTFAAELARKLPVVVVPGPAEVEQAREHYPACIRLEDVDMGVYAAVLARAAVVVANDTGPAHVAAAVAAPLVSVLGPSDASRYRPLGPRVALVQADPWPSVADVWSAVDQQLRRD